MTKKQFWKIIEHSWAESPELYKKRAAALLNHDEEAFGILSQKISETIRNNYSKRLMELSKEDFTSFIHILEERLYHIDRAEIHEFTDGSDDGFLYCRCFIVGMGEQYYRMIDETPSKATFDLESEMFGFEAYQVYEQKFGEEFERYSKHSIETCSNESEW